jgi:hypothetical protein
MKKPLEQSCKEDLIQTKDTNREFLSANNGTGIVLGKVHHLQPYRQGDAHL